MANKRKASVLPSTECKICRCQSIPNNVSHIARHEAGEKHQRLVELVNHQSILESWGIQLVEDKIVKYVCTFCETEMELSFPKMKQHFDSHHKLALELANIPTREVTKVYRRKKYYETEYNFEDDQVNFEVVDGSIAIQEKNLLSQNIMGIFLRELIPENKIPYLYSMASSLEKHGKEIHRGKRIAGSRMVMYGQFENHQLLWFLHPCAEMYGLSEVFMQKMYGYLKSAFPSVMDNMENILVNEGLDGPDGHFANTPFTCFAITRDYSCLPHDDPTDYGFGFIVWLHPSGGLKVEDQPTFWLPEYKMSFRCENGAGIVLNGNTTIHCTTSPKRTGVLGIAFVQKRSFITQLSKALKNLNGNLASSYFKAKDRYNTRRDMSTGDGEAATFY